MRKTPIQVLQDQIDYYTKFRIKLETRDGIIEASQDKLDKLICDTQIKVSEFEKAVDILRQNGVN